MPRPIHNIEVEFTASQWFRLLSRVQKRRLALTFASACPPNPPRSFHVENIHSPFCLCARSPINECRDEYVLIDGLPVPVRLCLQPSPIDHGLSKSLSFSANCRKHGHVPIVFIEAIQTCIGKHLYTIRTTWDAIYAIVTECKDLDDARCIVAAWLATSAGMEMHVRVDDWRDRILSRRDRDEAAKLHAKADRLLHELADPDGYFCTMAEYRDAMELTFPELPNVFRLDPMSPF